MKKHDNKTQFALYDKLINKGSLMMGKKNVWYYMSVFLINICVLAIISIIYLNKNSVIGGFEIWRDVDVKLLLLPIVLVVVMWLMGAFADYLHVLSRTRKHKFWPVASGEIEYKFYSSSTCFKCGECANVTTLHNGGLEKSVATEVVFTKKLLNKIAKIIYALAVFVAGSIFVGQSISTAFMILGVLGLMVLIVPIIPLIFYDKMKEKYLIIIGKVIKLLYKLKLVKDYESVYQLWSGYLAEYSCVFKNKKGILIVDLIIGVVKEFVRALILVSIINCLDIYVGEQFLEIIFKLVIVDLIVSVIPLPGGLIIFEVLFLSLFEGLVLIDNIVWVMLLFRICDYYINGIAMLLCMLIGKTCRLVKKKV